MSNYVAVSKETHKDLRWTSSGNFLFAAHDSLCPLVMQEAPTAHLYLPIAFSKVGEHFELFTVQGLEPSKNYLVDAAGKWLIDYIPAIYRGYPFAIADGLDDKQILCVNADSGLIGATGDNAFFDEDGKPTDLINEVMGFISNVIVGQKFTHSLCLLLNELDLLEPWPINLKKGDKETPLEGLYRVNETKFNELDGGSLTKLRDQRALPLIFCQLLSMQNIAKIAKLGAPRGNVVELDDELTFDANHDGGNINFDGI